MFSVIYFTIPFGQNDSQQGKVKYNLNKNNENTKHKYFSRKDIYDSKVGLYNVYTVSLVPFPTNRFIQYSHIII